MKLIQRDLPSTFYTQNCYQFYDTYSLIEEEKIYGVSLLDMPNALLAP